MGEFFYFTLNHCGHPANIAFFDCAMAVTEGFAPKTVRAGAHPLRPSNYIAFTGVWKVRRNKVVRVTLGGMSYSPQNGLASRSNIVLLCTIKVRFPAGAEQKIKMDAPTAPLRGEAKCHCHFRQILFQFRTG